MIGLHSGASVQQAERSKRRLVLHTADELNYRPRAMRKARWCVETIAHGAPSMKKPAPTLLQMVKYRDGVNGIVAVLAGVCAIVLLALFVQTLHVAIERGDALREHQRLARYAPARQVLATDTQVSDARIDTSR